MSKSLNWCFHYNSIFHERQYSLYHSKCYFSNFFLETGFPWGQSHCHFHWIWLKRTHFLLLVMILSRNDSVMCLVFNDEQMFFHTLVLPIQTFTAQICNATSMGLNPFYLLHILIVRRKFHSKAFFFKIYMK